MLDLKQIENFSFTSFTHYAFPEPKLCIPLLHLVSLSLSLFFCGGIYVLFSEFLNCVFYVQELLLPLVI